MIGERGETWLTMIRCDPISMTWNLAKAWQSNGSHPFGFFGRSVGWRLSSSPLCALLLLNPQLQGHARVPITLNSRFASIWTSCGVYKVGGPLWAAIAKYETGKEKNKSVDIYFTFIASKQNNSCSWLQELALKVAHFWRCWRRLTTAILRWLS